MPVNRNVSYYTTAPPNSTISEPQACATQAVMQNVAGDTADYLHNYYDTIDLQPVADRNQPSVSAKPTGKNLHNTTVAESL